MTIGRDEALKRLWKCLFHGNVVTPDELEEILTSIILSTPVPGGEGNDIDQEIQNARPFSCMEE